MALIYIKNINTNQLVQIEESDYNAIKTARENASIDYPYILATQNEIDIYLLNLQNAENEKNATDLQNSKNNAIVNITQKANIKINTLLQKNLLSALKYNITKTDTVSKQECADCLAQVDSIYTELVAKTDLINNAKNIDEINLIIFNFLLDI